MSTDSPVKPRAWSIEDLITRYASILITVTAIGYVSAVLLRISHGSRDTAFAVLRSAGTIDVAVGVGVQLVPLLLALLSVFVFYARRREGLTVAPVITAAILAIVLFLVPVGILLVAWAVVPVVRLADDLFARLTRQPRMREERLIPEESILSLAMVGVLLLVPTSPWMPSERLTLADGTSIVVYVLDDNGETLPVLSNQDRVVSYIRRSEIDDRTICIIRETSWYDRAFLDLFYSDDERPEYPRCDET